MLLQIKIFYKNTKCEFALAIDIRFVTGSWNR